MLPPRAYSEPRLPSTSPQVALNRSAEFRPVLVTVVSSSDLNLLPSGVYSRVAAQTTSEAGRLLQSARPRLLAVDLDLRGVDALELCTLARRIGGVSVLVMTDSPEKVPSALRAGCHAVLLKPLTLNLVSARLGRLCREGPREPHGTNRVWNETACPTCASAGAVSFEYSSHRRMWYACQQCDSVWMGPRQE